MIVSSVTGRIVCVDLNSVKIDLGIDSVGAVVLTRLDLETVRAAGSMIGKMATFDVTAKSDSGNRKITCKPFVEENK